MHVVALKFAKVKRCCFKVEPKETQPLEHSLKTRQTHIWLLSYIFFQTSYEALTQFPIPMHQDHFLQACAAYCPDAIVGLIVNPPLGFVFRVVSWYASLFISDSDPPNGGCPLVSLATYQTRGTPTKSQTHIGTQMLLHR